MPFQEGHPYYAPKDSIPGRGRLRSKQTRMLAVAVQERVSAGALADFHLFRAMRKPGVRLDWDEDGEVIAVYDEEGSPHCGPIPTDAEVVASVNWLSDRGHGLPAQSIQLEASIRASVASLSANVDLRQLTPAKIAAIRAVMSGRALAPGPAVAEVPAVGLPQVPATAADHADHSTRAAVAGAVIDVPADEIGEVGAHSSTDHPGDPPGDAAMRPASGPTPGG